MKHFIFTFLILIVSNGKLCAQNFPWNNPLKMAWSSDGITFNNTTTFQDSSGVPCVIKWKGDTLIAAFQWFRQPDPSPSWDRVATKFSYNNGLTWTTPVPITVSNLPVAFQRPFDPALVVLNSDSIRIYFSSGVKPMGGLDSSINTYSAVSTDGIHFEFEPNPRVDEPLNRVIDPSVIFFKNLWHYLSHIGTPQQGAYHYISNNGLNFLSVPVITSDNNHNMIGNYMVENSNELRFYGCGPIIWYNSSSNGGIWNGYVNTNVHGGDPSVIKISNGNYLMVYVGDPYNTGISNSIASHEKDLLQISPNPANNLLTVLSDQELTGTAYSITDQQKRKLLSGTLTETIINIDISNFSPGIYFLMLEDEKYHPKKIVKY